MSVYFCSDLHLGHKNIFRIRGLTPEENTERLIKDWLSLVRENNIVYVTGDVAFTLEGLHVLKNLPGKKILIKGNHDTFSIEEYLKIFDEIHGLHFKWNMQFSHAPVHPDWLRKHPNVHGHLHHNVVTQLKNQEQILDNRYLNICPENLYALYDLGILPRRSFLISLDEIRNYFKRFK